MKSLNDHDCGDAGIEKVFADFEGLLGISQEFLGKQRYVQAAVSAQIAALYASYNHPGLFVSRRLEDILQNIGRSAPGNAAVAGVRRSEGGAPKRVLHVLTAAKGVGGDSRFVWRWIQRDPKRCHSVALTYQLGFDVPAPLAATVAERGGCVHVLDRSGANAIQRARELREIARDADVVFLHVYPEDVVPVIAFADKTGLPPIVFVAQADHQFCTGVTVSDFFVHLRESGAWLSERRRGVDRAAMTPWLPIPLNAQMPTTSKSEAKKKIGLSENTTVLLSIARAIKYQPIEGEPSFIQVLLPIINRYPDAVLLVIGPADADDWQLARAKSGGRIRAFGQRSDTQVFYEAADIYLDSFPFTSNTSLLEAGSVGMPLVSYFPYSADSSVLGPGSPGLDGSLIRAANVEDYRASVSRLIDDTSYRTATGQRTRNDITSHHVGDNWNHALESMYRSLLVPAPKSVRDGESDQSGATELDRLLNRYYSRHVPLGWVIGWYARHLPYWLRFQLLAKMLRVNRSFAFSMFLPDGIQRSLGGRLRGWRQLPVIARWLSVRGH